MKAKGFNPQPEPPIVTAEDHHLGFAVEVEVGSDRVIDRHREEGGD